MDPISIVGASVAIIGFIGHGLSNPNSKESNTYGRLAAVYGKIPALVIKFGLPETFEALENVDKVTHGNDQIALAFKNSYGSIIAQVAITALSLQFLSLAHWVSRAFFIASLISASFSVYSAVILQRKIGRLYEAQDVKNWILGSKDGSSRVESFKNVTSTLIAAQMLAAPSSMVNISLSSFLAGLAVYLYFVWKRKLDTDAGLNDSRDVFITFIICLSLFFGVYTIPIGIKVSWDRAMEIFQPEREPRNPREDPNGLNVNHLENVSLISALEAAATAHIRSAEADRLVAMEYARALASMNLRPANHQPTEA